MRFGLFIVGMCALVTGVQRSRVDADPTTTLALIVVGAVMMIIACVTRSKEDFL